MALSNPYPLDFLSDVLKASATSPELVRSDEMSGAGSGQFWSAELARPVWQFKITLAARWADQARAIDAKIWALGTNKKFLFADPAYRGPAAGGTPGASVVVSAIGATLESISLAGLPGGFQVSAGDRLSIVHDGRVYFGTFVEDATADGSGVLGQTAIFPALNLGVEVGDSVEMQKPYFAAFVPPNGYTAFTSIPGYIGQSASLTIMQKV